jgi:hypothetical protein
MLSKALARSFFGPSVAWRGSLGNSLILVGPLDEARKLIEEELEGLPDNDLHKLARLAGLAAREGRRGEVLRISPDPDSIQRALRGWAVRRNDTLYRITIAAALGDRERGMALLHDRGYDRWIHM